MLKDVLTAYLVLSTPMPQIAGSDRCSHRKTSLKMNIPMLMVQGHFYHERKSIPVEKEPLAIVDGTKHFREYLVGTDSITEAHNLLTHMVKLKHSHGRIRV